MERCGRSILVFFIDETIEEADDFARERRPIRIRRRAQEKCLGARRQRGRAQDFAEAVCDDGSRRMLLEPDKKTVAPDAPDGHGEIEQDRVRLERSKFLRDLIFIRCDVDAPAVLEAVQGLLHGLPHDLAVGNGIVNDQHVQRSHSVPSFCSVFCRGIFVSYYFSTTRAGSQSVFCTKKQKHSQKSLQALCFPMELIIGLEPTTCSLRMSRSTN